MDSYDVISAEIDRVLLHHEINDHLSKKNVNRKKPVTEKDHNQKESKSTKSHSFKVNKNSKIETITIPATTSKVIINLSS